MARVVNKKPGQVILKLDWITDGSRASSVSVDTRVFVQGDSILPGPMVVYGKAAWL